jgi:hypothetical protein
MPNRSVSKGRTLGLAATITSSGRWSPEIRSASSIADSAWVSEKPSARLLVADPVEVADDAVR